MGLRKGWSSVGHVLAGYWKRLEADNSHVGMVFLALGEDGGVGPFGFVFMPNG
jgi:hypothetical protein